MTFRSLATLEGGTPADISDTPGEPAGTRWVGFGEQVTSSIANRPHHALGENTDDLNTRLVVWETDGLDAAYDLGGAATPGGGRIITKDAGAIETSSGLVNDYADDPANAHFRVDVLSDSIESSVGYDHRGGFDPDEFANGSGGIGFLDRRRFAVRPAGFASSFSEGESVTLNPGGVLGDTVRLTDGSVFWRDESGPTPPAGSYTSLFLGVDLIEITGTSNNDGLYIINALGGVGTDVKLTTLDGSTPSFVSDASGTATVYRLKLGTVGSSTSRTALSNNVLAASIRSDSAVDLLGGDDISPGSFRPHALRVLFHANDGSLVTGSWIDSFGRMHWSLQSSDLPYDYGNTSDIRRRVDGGAYATKIDRTGHSDMGFGHMSKSDDAGPDAHYDFLSLDLVDPAGTGLDSAIDCVFVANSPVNGQIDAKAGELSGAWRDYLVGHFMIVEILATAGDVEGFYWLKSTSSSGDGQFFIDNLDGTTPTHLPTSGDTSIRVHSLTAALGRRVSASGFQALSVFGVTADPIIPCNTFTSTPEDGSVAAAFVVPELSAPSKHAFWRAYSMDTSSGADPKELAYLEGTGIQGAQRFVRHDDTTITRVLSLAEGVDMFFTSDSTGWAFDASLPPRLVSEKDNGLIAWPLKLPPGSTIEQVDVIWEPGASRGSGDRMDLRLVEVEPDFGTLAINQSVITSVDDGGSSSISINSLTTSLPHTLEDTKYYEIRIEAGNTGATEIDTIHGLRIRYKIADVELIPMP